MAVTPNALFFPAGSITGGVFNVGDTITDTTSGATGTVISEGTFSGIYYLILDAGTTTGTFNTGDTIVDDITGATGVTNEISQTDTYTWTDGTTTVTNIPMFIQAMSFGMSINGPRVFHQVGDNWMLTVSPVLANIINAYGGDTVTFLAGDLGGIGNNTTIFINDSNAATILNSKTVTMQSIDGVNSNGQLRVNGVVDQETMKVTGFSGQSNPLLSFVDGTTLGQVSHVNADGSMVAPFFSAQATNTPIIDANNSALLTNGIQSFNWSSIPTMGDPANVGHHTNLSVNDLLGLTQVSGIYPAIGPVVFTGAGLNDLTASGFPSGGPFTYHIIISVLIRRYQFGLISRSPWVLTLPRENLTFSPSGATATLLLRPLFWILVLQRSQGLRPLAIRPRGGRVPVKQPLT